MLTPSQTPSGESRFTALSVVARLGSLRGGGRSARVQQLAARERPIELRPVEFGRYMGQPPDNGRFNVWFRATGRLPDDPSLHRCVLAYASDLMLLDAALMPHNTSVFDKTIMAASIDHALWFHRPFRADEWLLYAQDSPSGAGARGFNRGSLFTRDGKLVASVAQEGLMRKRRERLS